MKNAQQKLTRESVAALRESAVVVAQAWQWRECYGLENEETGSCVTGCGVGVYIGRRQTPTLIASNADIGCQTEHAAFWADVIAEMERRHPGVRFEYMPGSMA